MLKERRGEAERRAEKRDALFLFKQLEEGASHRRVSLQGLKDFGHRPDPPGLPPGEPHVSQLTGFAP